MHPDMMRELAEQRGREMRARAQQATLARRIRKETRRRTAAAAEFALPRIPDYVDGTFRDTELAGHGARPDDERPGRRQAAGRRAA
ncbi:MAG TPA: hypothetical protein VF482_16690 [Trebonia sp.]